MFFSGLQLAFEKSKPLLRPVLNPVWFGVNKAAAIPPLRKFFTDNFRSGLIALGERNGTGIPWRWITVDVTGADLTQDFRFHPELPFQDSTQRVVYSAHMIEHMDEPTILSVFREARRILKPGGYIRLEAPDAEKIIAAYLAGDEEFFRDFQRQNLDLHKNFGYPEAIGERHVAFIGLLSCYIEHGCHIPVIATRREVDEKVRALDLESFVNWCVMLQTPVQHASRGHVTAIYFAKLKRLLEEAGFETPSRMANRQTSIPNLSLRRIERTHRDFCSIFVEARKP